MEESLNQTSESINDNPEGLPVHGPKCKFVFPPKKDGKAIYKYPNDYFRYIGEWKSGQKNGTGKFMIGSNSYYEGEFKDGEITGKGERYFSNGNYYKGEFLNGEFNGKGEFVDKTTGEEYDGEWKDNRRHGQGVLRYKDGTKYMGSFENHKKHGQGEYTSIEGNRYVGEWKENRIEGTGIMYYVNGDVYEGEFLDGKRNGLGTIKWAQNGLSYTGKWDNETNTYNPTGLAISDPLPPITPGTTLEGISVSVIGGDGESGRSIKIMIEIGRVDPNAPQKKTVKSKKNEPIEHEPKFLQLAPESNELLLTVENGVAIVPPISIPLEAEQNTYTISAADMTTSEGMEPLALVFADFQWVNAAQSNMPTEKTSAKGRGSRRGGTPSRASDRRSKKA